MMTHKGQIDLKIPSVVEDPDFNFDIRPHKVEKWVEKLPLTNTGQTARLTFNTLVKLNRHPIPAKNRIKILEAFRPAVRYLLETTRKHFFGSVIPISEKNKTVAHLAQSLQEEMANGYKIVIMENQNGERSRLDSKTQALIAHRALYYLGGMLFTSYQIYMPYPAGVWRDIHQIFHFAERLDLLHDAVNDIENDLAPWSSILDSYKQIALFALADPYHLSQHEMEKLRKALHPWASSCQLNRCSDDIIANKTDAILIKPHDDLPPTKRVSKNEQQILQYRSLDTSGALHKIRKNLSVLSNEQTARQQSPNHLPYGLLTHLSKAWNPAVKRRYTRKNHKATLNVAFGLDATHHFVNGNKNSFTRDSNTDVLDSLFHSTRFTVSDDIPEGMAQLDTIDVWELNNPRPIESDMDEKPPEDTDEPAKTILSNRPSYRTNRCTVINESAGGLCIQLPQKNPPLIHIGELLCLQDATTASDYWEIGVIRWIKNIKDQTIKIGIQLLSPSAEAVALSTYYSDGSETGNEPRDYVRGLLLPEIKALKQPRSLITRINCYQPGSIVSLLENGTEQRYTLLTMLESTYGYNRFEVIPHISSNKLSSETASKNGSMAKTKEAFGDIWSTL